MTQTQEACLQRVVIQGLRPGVDLNTAIQNLAGLFKSSPEHAEQILKQPGFVVKKGIAADVAAKYQKAVEAAGVVCVIEAEASEQLDFDLGDAKPAAVSEETVLFQGDVSNITSLTNILEGDGVVTNQGCKFDWGKQSFSASKADIAKVEEQKHGFGTKILVEHKNGSRILVQAANMRGLKNALYSLAGMPVDVAAMAAPEISQVKNGTAWLAAFAPLIISTLCLMVWGSRMEYWGFFAFLKLWVFKIFLIYFFMRIDHITLQRQGFNTVQLGLTPPEKFWSYLFNRAKAFNHGKAYAIVWAVIFGLDVAGLVLGLLGDA